MPHEVMNASRQTHNESDIPEIRVKTAYNGQVIALLNFALFGANFLNQVDLLFFTLYFTNVELRIQKAIEILLNSQFYF